MALRLVVVSSKRCSACVAPYSCPGNSRSADNFNPGVLSKKGSTCRVANRVVRRCFLS